MTGSIATARTIGISSRPSPIYFKYILGRVPSGEIAPLAPDLGEQRIAKIDKLMALGDRLEGGAQRETIRDRLTATL